MQNNANNKEEKSTNNLMRFSGIGFQMIVIIGVFAFIGYKMDNYFENNDNLYTAILSLLGVVLALIQVIIQVKKG